MWEDVTIAFCGLGFSAAAALLMCEVIAVASDWQTMRHHSHQ